ncbi:SDR family oxidoreductase [Bdellovibrio sp. NC01]|uniref:SDR family NAD(P)-dependent oxidoreductase n=1 Tax=Bdellovibrio sp. NC01 TaxID=2220073 RepID=UPI001AF0054D|nr:SDR family oxidoreductase [Bdellovibrio sp. NC01]
MKTLAKRFLMGVGLGFLGSMIYTKFKESRRYIDFEGNVVVITGGSRGLGLLLAKEFAQDGASIALLARDSEELLRAKNILQFECPDTLVHTYACDCTINSQVVDTVSHILHDFGSIDILINNAGVISSMPIENATAKDFEESIDTHFWGPFHMVEACLPHMTAGSRIVNISSIGGLIPVPHLAAYCTGKFALTGYSQSLRAELMKDGIYVTTVCPNLMRTGSIDHAKFKGQATKEYTIFAILDSLPLISQNAEKSAKEIREAVRWGKAELTISLTAKLAHRINVHFPEFFSDIIGLANRFLPEGTADRETQVEGRSAHTALAPSVLTRVSEKAARLNNEGEIHH